MYLIFAIACPFSLSACDFLCNVEGSVSLKPDLRMHGLRLVFCVNDVVPEKGETTTEQIDKRKDDTARRKAAVRKKPTNKNKTTQGHHFFRKQSNQTCVVDRCKTAASTNRHGHCYTRKGGVNTDSNEPRYLLCSAPKHWSSKMCVLPLKSCFKMDPPSTYFLRLPSCPAHS